MAWIIRIFFQYDLLILQYYLKYTFLYGIYFEFPYAKVHFILETVRFYKRGKNVPKLRLGKISVSALQR